MSATADRLADLRAGIDETFDEVIGRPESVALLMYPYDGNVGNHMMWLAATDYLADRGIRITYAAHTNNLDVDAMRRAIGEGPILFLGGVALSRLWPAHVEAKTEVAEAFPDHPIVTLTSTTMLFDDDDRRAVRDVFRGHPDVTLLVRDPVSGDRARDVFGESVRVHVQHDSAFRLATRELPSSGSGIGWLARDDVEGREAGAADVDTFDWPNLYEPVHRRRVLRLRATGVLSRVRTRAPVSGRGAGAINAAITRTYRTVSEQMLDYGIDTLAAHSVLVTDRMHPHVLALLIGRPVVLLPDRYGKNRAVYDYSSHGFDSVHWADEPAEALEIARALAR